MRLNPIGGSVQFDHADAVLQAYENWNTPAWAIFNGKQFLFKYQGTDTAEGAQILRQCLEAMGNSAAKYTLAIYEEVPPKGIKPSTEWDGSFNFMLNDMPLSAFPTSAGRVSGLQAMHSEIAALKEQIKELNNREAEQPQSFSGIAMGMLNQPEIQMILVTKILEWFTPSKGAAADPAQVDGIKPGMKIAGIETMDWREGLAVDQVVQIDQALQVLCRQKDFPELLTKLATMATKQPMQYSFYVGMFKSFKV